jgi:transketolase
MGDGEQQKGQIAEARRFAVKYELNNLLALVDRNHLQIGGNTGSVMPQAIRADYVAAQWNQIYVEDGHDFDQLFQAFRKIRRGDVDDPRYPTAIIARTVMGKGVSFMENKAKYHGSTLNDDEAGRAIQELGLENPLPEFRQKRKIISLFKDPFCPIIQHTRIETGAPRTYSPDILTDNRSAYGAVLEDLARLNNNDAVPKVLGFSCDLEGSVKMEGFHRLSEKAFFEAGIQEHHTATMAGAISKEGFLPFYSTFGVFAVDEVYNQLRLNDINHSQLKVVCTHLGLDVGEDGQTHQCIDYLGLMQNLFGFDFFMPADPNQTERIIRAAAAHPGNVFVGMGRSKMPVVTDEHGAPFFGGGYTFRPGKADWVRRGDAGAILSLGAVFPFAVNAADELAKEHGLNVAVVNFGSFKPFDREAVLKACKTGLLVTVEDHHADTGLGAKVSTVLADEGVSCRLIRLGVRKYGLSGKPEDLYALEGLDKAGIVKTVLEAKKAAGPM